MRRSDLHYSKQSEVGIHIDDRAVRGEGERSVTIPLAVLIELPGLGMVVFRGELEEVSSDRLGDHHHRNTVSSNPLPLDPKSVSIEFPISGHLVEDLADHSATGLDHRPA